MNEKYISKRGEIVEKKIDLKNGYFDLNYYLQKLNLSWDESFVLIFCSHKNTGKSTSVWNNTFKEIVEKRNKKIAYLRTNLTKQKEFKSGFNDQFKKRYLISDNTIYRPFYNDEDKEIIKERVKVGSVHGVVNQENNASNFFNDYQLIFWDEFNERAKVKDLWDHFNILIKTIKRTNNPLQIILCGNRIDGDNDILVNFEVEYVKEWGDDDHIQQLKEGSKIYYIDVHPDHFNAIEANDPNDIVSQVASFNEDTDRFLNKAGFLKMRDERVTLHKHIAPSKCIRYYILIHKDIFEFGEWEKGLYFHKIKEYNVLPEITQISLDNISYLEHTNSRNLISENEYLDFAENLKNAIRHNRLFFTTNEAKETIFNYISLITNLIN